MPTKSKAQLRYERQMRTPVKIPMGPLDHALQVWIAYSEEAWRRVMPKGAVLRNTEYCKTGACCWEVNPERIIVVCFDMKQMDKLLVANALGLIAHEATHVAQFAAKCMHEQNGLSEEMQAYVVQHVTAACWHHMHGLPAGGR